MRRGEIWTCSGGGDYTGKPRPVLIVQSDLYVSDSATVCPLTTTLVDAKVRIALSPSDGNGLNEPSAVMVDKISSVPRSKIGSLVGALTGPEMAAVDRAILLFLGLDELGAAG